MAQYDIQDENGKVIFTVEGDEPPTADDIEELLAAHGGDSPAPTPAKPQATSGQPDLFSARTIAPAAVEALSQPATDKDRAMVQSQLDIQAAAPIASNMVPGGAGMPAPVFSEQSMKAGLGAIKDFAGGVFRLAGSLIPSRATRGEVQDPTAPGGVRTRTATEALQNPNGQLLTGLSEDIDNSDAPAPVKAVGQVLLGAAEGGAAGAAKGAAGLTVRSLLTKGAEASGLADAAQGAAKYVQNVRMGTTAADINKGASAGAAMKHGLGNKTLKTALPEANAKIDNWMSNMKGIYKKKSGREISVDDILREADENINAKEFGQAEKQAALQEIRQEINNVLSRKPGSTVATEGFTPRRSISQLTQDEIQAGVNDGSIRYSQNAGKIPFEYTKPEVVPENFAPKQGQYLTLEEADKLKNWLQEHGANYGKGAPRESKSAERVFRDVYKYTTQKAEAYGGPDYTKLNKNLSELIPIRNVIERTLKRGELGSDVVDKGGMIKRGLNAAASATGVNRFGATAVYDAGNAVKDFAQVPLRDAAQQGAASGFQAGVLRGSLVGGSR